MSHFVVGVILPLEREDEAGQRHTFTLDTPYPEIEAEVARLLAPYDENTEVEEYDRECHCIGQVANMEAARTADALCGDRDDLRALFTLPEHLAKLPPIEQFNHPEIEALWDQHLAKWNQTRQEAFERHPLKDKPDPTCGFYSAEFLESFPTPNVKPGDRYEDGSGCGGTGTYRTTYNPQSRWDWFVIGGRWNGYFKPDDFAPGGSLSEDEVYDLDGKNIGRSGNLSLVHEVPPERLPFAIVDPTGVWLEQGKMGWFGISTKDKTPEEWEQTRNAVFSEFMRNLIVVVDCHI